MYLPRNPWKDNEKREFMKAFKTMLESRSEIPVNIRENISNRKLCEMYQYITENKYGFWVELARLLPRDVNRNSR